MSGDLGALIREAEAGWELVEAGQTLDQVGRARLVGRARRSRAVRAVAVAAAAVVLVGGAAGGAVLLARPDPVPPVGPTPSHTAAPSPSETPTPTPTSTPTPAETASALPDLGFAGTVTADPHLPSAEPITPEVWAQAGSGWVLASYREADGAGNALGPQVIYLISPDGVRYQLTEVPGERVDVLVWTPGSTVALARTYDRSTPSWSPSLVRVDLLTGAVAPGEVDLEGAIVSIGVPLADGRLPIPARDGGRVAIGVDGSVVPDTTLEAPGALAAAQARYPGSTCRVQARYDADSVLVDCRGELDDVDYAPQWPLAAEAPVLLRAWEAGNIEVLAAPAPGTDPYPYVNTVTLAGGVPVYEGEDAWFGDCPSGIYAVTGGRTTLLPGVGAAAAQYRPSPYQTQANAFLVVGVAGRSVYTVDVAGCSGDPEPATLVRDDLATGAFVELVPYPAAATTDPDAWISQSLTGWYVVP